MDTMNFDIAPVTIPVTISGVPYILKEASEAAAAEYQNARMRGAQLDGEKVVKLPEDLAGIQSLLLSRCLYPTKPDGSPADKPVPRQVILGWPNRVVKPLFSKVKEISELDEKEDEASLLKQRAEIEKKLVAIKEGPAKNAPSDMEDGSFLPATTES